MARLRRSRNSRNFGPTSQLSVRRLVAAWRVAAMRAASALLACCAFAAASALQASAPPSPKRARRMSLLQQCRAAHQALGVNPSVCDLAAGTFQKTGENRRRMEKQRRRSSVAPRMQAPDNDDGPSSFAEYLLPYAAGTVFALLATSAFFAFLNS